MVVIRQSPRVAAARSAAARHAHHAASHMHMADPVPVSVDGRDIPEEEIRAEMHNHPGPDPDTARNAAAQALVIRELLLNAARARDITARPGTDGQGRQELDDEALIRALLDAEVTTPQADTAACRRHYDSHPGRFTTSPVWEARHILLAATETDEAGRKAARERAQAILAELASDPDRFADLATAFSACPSRAEGGRLGQLVRGSTVPEFEAALARMSPGEIASAPVETRFGLHVVALDRHLPGAVLPFEAVEARIAAWLEAASWSRGVAQFISVLAAEADIRGVALATAEGPLVR
ncbi:peptidylprolyl isomerase (plasmid) [Tistrella mobilis]|uniref:peptidylprolyl isomerase n=1 Tax=Tistrella mobilis TaxID=171437 RepID=UPI0035574C3B